MLGEMAACIFGRPPEITAEEAEELEVEVVFENGHLVDPPVELDQPKEEGQVPASDKNMPSGVTSGLIAWFHSLL